MKIEETQNRVIGEVVIEKRNAAGELIERIEMNNLVVDTGKQNLARLIGSEQTNRHITKIGFGTNGTATAGGDNALTSAFVKAIGAVTYPETTSVQYAWSLGLTEGSGTAIREIGLITAGDVLFARIAREVITKTADFSLSGSWKITF